MKKSFILYLGEMRPFRWKKLLMLGGTAIIHKVMIKIVMHMMVNNNVKKIKLSNWKSIPEPCNLNPETHSSLLTPHS